MDNNENQTKEALERIAQFQRECGEYGLAISAMGLIGRPSALSLVKAQEHRNHMIKEPEITDWLQALAEVSTIFRFAQDNLEGERQPHPAAQLIGRAQRDIEMVVELTMSGLLSVAFDIMRDLYEIESLLKDFLAYPGNMDEWASEKKPESYKHVQLRKREQNITNEPTNEMMSKHIYNAHSNALHVNPKSLLSPIHGIQAFAEERSKWPIYDLLFHLSSLVPVVMIYGGVLADESTARDTHMNLKAFDKVCRDAEAFLRAQSVSTDPKFVVDRSN